MRFLRRHWAEILLVLIFIAGAGLISYPTVSDMVNRHSSSRIIESYGRKVEAMDQENYDREREAAEAYNIYIASFPDLSSAVQAEEPETAPGYDSCLNLSDTGMMGFLDIPSIKVHIPVFHGTEETVLDVAAGHYKGSSLPVGGPSTHSIITGHTGLPSAKLFTDLDQLREGDLFYIHVLGDSLTYRVSRIDVVLPEEVESLSVEAGKDLVTLVTCTPYGVNTHRLLVCGERTSEEAVPQEIQDKQGTGAGREEPGQMPAPGKWSGTAWCLAAAAVVLAAAVLAALIPSGKKKEKKGGGNS